MPKVARDKAEVDTWLSDHGYAFEHESARAFKEAGYTTRISRPYNDPIERKVREVDVWATPTFATARRTNDVGSAAVQVHLAIECKARTTGAWLVRTGGPTKPEERAWLPIASRDLTNDFELTGAVVTGRMVIGDPLAFTALEAHSPKPVNEAYDAINQAVHAAIALAATLTGLAIVYPVVALKTTKLFTVDYPGSDPVINEVHRARVLWSGSPALSGPTAVEILSMESWPLKELALDLRDDLADFYIERARQRPPFGAAV